MIGNTVSTSGRDSFQLWSRPAWSRGATCLFTAGLSEGRVVPNAVSDHLLHTPTSLGALRMYPLPKVL